MRSSPKPADEKQKEEQKKVPALVKMDQKIFAMYQRLMKVKYPVLEQKQNTHLSLSFKPPSFAHDVSHMAWPFLTGQDKQSLGQTNRLFRQEFIKQVEFGLVDIIKEIKRHHGILSFKHLAVTDEIKFNVADMKKLQGHVLEDLDELLYVYYSNKMKTGLFISVGTGGVLARLGLPYIAAFLVTVPLDLFVLLVAHHFLTHPVLEKYHEYDKDVPYSLIVAYQKAATWTERWLNIANQSQSALEQENGLRVKFKKI